MWRKGRRKSYHGLIPEPSFCPHETEQPGLGFGGVMLSKRNHVPLRNPLPLSARTLAPATPELRAGGPGDMWPSGDGARLSTRTT